MPTVGWIQDSAGDRITDAFPFSLVAPEPHQCPLCSRLFVALAELRTHLGLDHPMQRPVLRVGSRTGLDRFELRSPFGVGDIEAMSCTICTVSTNGSAAVSVPANRIAELIIGKGNACHVITLRNGRSVDEREAITHVELRVAIPSQDALTEIDHQFIKHLAHDRITIRMVDGFRRSSNPERAAEDYLGALADYSVGVVLKEQRRDGGAGEPFAAFSGKFQSARRQLEGFRRPLAGAVVALIDFNLNHFQNGGLPQFPDLEMAHRFFWALTPAQKAAPSTKREPNNAIAACPVDAVTAAIWEGLKPFPNVPGILDSSEHLTSTQGMLLSEFDLAKLRALKASAALLLNQRVIARDHFRALRHDQRFGPWADSHLEALPNS